MTENKRFTYEVTDTGKYYYDNGVRIFPRDFWQIIHDLNDENEQLKSINQSLRNELKFDAKQYKIFLDVIKEADKLIMSHLSKHYQRQWKNICKHKEVLE